MSKAGGGEEEGEVASVHKRPIHIHIGEITHTKKERETCMHQTDISGMKVRMLP